MNDMSTLTSVPHQAAQPGTPMRPADVTRRHLVTVRSMIATWRWRIHFRWDLEQKSRADAHLIDDIGLTRRQVETEIAKPFWQA